MDNLIRAEPLDQARADCGALTGAANDGNRPGRIQTVRESVDVMPGLKDRFWNVSGIPLGAFANV